MGQQNNYNIAIRLIQGVDTRENLEKSKKRKTVLMR